MHNLKKIRLFGALLRLTYVPALLLYPFAWMKRKNSTGYFFFFDRYVIGGAQRVHIDILNSTGEGHKQVYFTRYSPNDKLKEDFYQLPGAECRDIHFWCDNLLLRLFTVHFYVFYINMHRRAVVLSSNSTFFYDMLPWLGKGVVKAELLHNFTYGDNGMEFFGLANHQYLQYRLTVDSATVHNIREQYREYHVPAEYNDRVRLIEPGVYVPEKQDKEYTLPLKVLYAGRGTPQKRIYLLNRIAQRCISEGLPVQFHFAGTMMDELSDDVKAHSVIHGEVSTQEAMYRLYADCHAILMTSAYEGFPMLIKEGMTNGCIPVVTALEGNKSHLRHNENSLLIDRPEDEEHVVQAGYEYMVQLCGDMQEARALSHRCYAYAQLHFDRRQFIQKYRALLEEMMVHASKD